jgi:predicted small secreted protein
MLQEIRKVKDSVHDYHYWAIRWGLNEQAALSANFLVVLDDWSTYIANQNTMKDKGNDIKSISKKIDRLEISTENKVKKTKKVAALEAYMKGVKMRAQADIDANRNAKAAREAYYSAEMYFKEAGRY